MQERREERRQERADEHADEHADDAGTRRVEVENQREDVSPSNNERKENRPLPEVSFNDQDKLPGRLERRCFAKSRDAGPVNFIG